MAIYLLKRGVIVKRIDIEYEIFFKSEFFTGGGTGNSYADNYVLKDSSGNPYIPSSLIKGKLRYYSEVIANTVGSTNLACKLNSNHNKNYNEENSECKCSICIVYGWQGNKKGFLTFYDAKLSNNKMNEDNGDVKVKGIYKNRTGTTIDRYVKTVKKGALYTIETTIDGLSFGGEISGFLPDETYKRDIFLLKCAFNLVDSFGGNQSRGLGFVDTSKTKFEVYIDKNNENSNVYDWKEGEKECFTK